MFWSPPQKKRELRCATCTQELTDVLPDVDPSLVTYCSDRCTPPPDQRMLQQKRLEGMMR